MDLFSWTRFFDNIPRLMKFFPVTLEIVAAAEIAGIVLGVGVALARIHRVPVLRQFLACYVSFIRGTPMLVQMLLVYYGLPMLSKALTGYDMADFSKLFFVITAYALNQGVFLSEIFRSSILAIPAGQTEAAYSVGLTKWRTFTRIIMPQAARIAIPSFGVDLIGLFQGTSIAFLVGIIDIMGRAKAIGTNTGHVLECYVFITIVFVVISLILRLFFHVLDKRVLKT